VRSWQAKTDGGEAYSRQIPGLCQRFQKFGSSPEFFTQGQVMLMILLDRDKTLILTLAWFSKNIVK
jgi:hypothetical protein